MAPLSRPARILFVARDAAQAALVGDALVTAHHVVRCCIGTAPIPTQVAAFRPDIVVIGFPAGEGATTGGVVDGVRASARPLLLCIVEGGAPERAAVLEAGADAYLHEPFTVDDLLLHVQALARRVPWLDHDVVQVGRLVIDESAHVALFDDRPVELAAKEFQVLARLAHHAGTVVSKRALLEALWDVETYDENLVEAHVSALRRRLPAPARAMLQTVRGVGYVLRRDQTAKPAFK